MDRCRRRGARGRARRKQIKRTFPRKDDAQTWLNETLAGLKSGSFTEPTKITFGQYLETWLAALPAKGRRPTTVESYSRHVRLHVLAYPVAQARLQQLSALHLDQLYSELLEDGRADRQGGLSHRSVQFVHSVISRALNDALRKRLVSVNVATAANAPSRSSTRPPEAKVWSIEQERIFLDSPAVRGDRYFALWRLACMTGMRRGELIGLRWSDVDFDHDRLSIRQTIVPVHGRPTVSDTKTHRSERTIDLDTTTLAELRRHRARQGADKLAVGADYTDADLVFAHPDGHMLNPKRVTEWFKRRAAAAGVPACRLHDLRHAHASHLLARGVPTKVVSERLGHAQESFTMSRYQHILPGMQADAAQGFADLIDGARNIP